MEMGQGSTQISKELRGKLQVLGICREKGQKPKVEGAASAAGDTLSKRSIGSSPNTFQARTRSGQESPGARTPKGRSPQEQEPPQAITSSRGGPQTEEVRQEVTKKIKGWRIRQTEDEPEGARGASYGANKATC